MANNSRIHVVFCWNIQLDFITFVDMIGSFIWLNIKMPYANISIIIYTRSWKFHHVNENYVILNFLKITNWNIGIQLGITYKVY